MTAVNACYSKPHARKHNDCDKGDFDKHFSKHKDACKPEPTKPEPKCDTGKADRIERKLEKIDAKLEKILDKICDTSKKMDSLMDRCGGSDKGHRSNGSDKSNGSDNSVQGLLKQILALLDKLCGGNAGSKSGSAGSFGGNNTLGGMNSDLSKLLKQLQDYCGGNNGGGKAGGTGGSYGGGSVGSSTGNSDLDKLIKCLQDLIGQINGKTGGDCGTGSVGGGKDDGKGVRPPNAGPKEEPKVGPKEPPKAGPAPKDDCPPAKLANWTATDVCNGKATINLGNNWTLDLNEADMSFTIKDANGCDVPVTKVWGDPHVDVNGKRVFDFKHDSSFILPDGTKITVNTIEFGNGASVSSRLTITKGDNAAVVTGLGGDRDGNHNLKIDIKDGQGRKLDKQVDDGQRYYGTKDGWVVKNETIKVDQNVVNQLEDKKKAARSGTRVNAVATTPIDLMNRIRNSLG